MEYLVNVQVVVLGVPRTSTGILTVLTLSARILYALRNGLPLVLTVRHTYDGGHRKNQANGWMCL